MKNLFLLFSLVLTFAGIRANCQDHAAVSVKEAAAAAATLDASIVKKVDVATGEASYFRKEVCPNTGKATLTAVEFCTKSGKFVTVTALGKVSCNKSGENAAARPHATMVSAPAAELPANCTAAQRAACAAACGKAKSAGTVKPRLVSNNN